MGQPAPAISSFDRPTHGALCSTPQNLAHAHYYRVPCSNAASTRNPLKFAAMPQTGHHISAASGSKFAILWGMWRRYCCLTSFSRLSIHALVAKIQPDKVVRWCPDGDFFASFCVLYFQRAVCGTFETCILNSHEGHTMCGSMVDIHSATAELRRGKKEELEMWANAQRDGRPAEYRRRPLFDVLVWEVNGGC